MDPMTSQTTEVGASHLRRWGAWLTNLSLFVLSTLIILGVLEIGIRLVAPQNVFFFDESAFRRNAWEYLPGAAHSSYVGVPVQINNVGFRGEDVALPKPAGIYRIVGVGDSITFGYGVPYEDTFLKVLETGLNQEASGGTHYETINAGVTGTGLDYYSYFVRNTAPKLQADMVLICMALNDIIVYRQSADSGPPAPGRDSTARNLLEQLFHHSQLYAASYVKVKSVLYGLGILDLHKLHGYDYLPLEPPSPAQEKAWNSTFAMLEGIVKVARERNLRLGLVVFPMEQQLSAALLDLYQKRLHLSIGPEALSGKPQEILKGFAERNRIDFVDLLPAFRAAAATTSNSLFLRNVAVNYDPVHPSVFGHRVAGEAIRRALERSFR